MSEVRKGQNGSGGGAQTLAEAAFIELRRQLLSGALQPGEPLRLERLKQDLKIGFTPLREALMLLSSEGIDRKGVVEGKRGTVREDTGGRRNMTKKRRNIDRR